MKFRFDFQVGRKCKFFQWLDNEICVRGKVLIPEQRQIILRLEDEVSNCKKREKCLTVSLILALVMCGICLCVILALVDLLGGLWCTAWWISWCREIKCLV